MKVCMQWSHDHTDIWENISPLSSLNPVSSTIWIPPFFHISSANSRITLGDPLVANLLRNMSDHCYKVVNTYIPCLCLWSCTHVIPVLGGRPGFGQLLLGHPFHQLGKFALVMLEHVDGSRSCPMLRLDVPSQIGLVGLSDDRSGSPFLPELDALAISLHPALTVHPR